MAFSPGGQLIASASWDASVRVSNVRTGKEIVVQPKGERKYGIREVAFSPNGYLIGSVSCGAKSGIYQPLVWDRASGAIVQPGSQENRTLSYKSLTFSPDSGIIAFACDVVRLFDVDSGIQIATFPSELDKTTAVRFSTDGKLLFSGQYDGVIQIWDVQQRELLRTLTTLSSAVTCLEVTTDGRWLASTVLDGTICRWSVSGREECPSYRGEWDSTNYMAFLPDSTDLISFHDSDKGPALYRWSPDAEGPTLWWPGHEISAVAVSPDGQQIATAAKGEGGIKIWNLADVLPPSSATSNGKASATLVPARNG